MATTARPWEVLVVGIRDSSGVAVASGKIRWYNPGTLVAAVAYSDAACSSAITAPLTLNAQGQGTIYFLEPVRVIVKDSTETTTYYDDIAALNRHDSVYVTSPGINSGAETTLELVLASATTALGAGFQYKESSGATARNYVDVLGEVQVSVKDFNAVGDGTTDDTTAIQAASDRVKARGGGWVLFPKGTYKITSAISIDTAGVSWRGTGRTSIIKNFSTSANAITVNLGSAIDCKLVLRDFAITANTTSSGQAINAASNCNRIRVENVAVALHRTGINVGTEGRITACIVDSTDDNASAIGLGLTTRGRAENCQVVSGTVNGTGISAVGADHRVIDCYVEKFSSGISLGGSGGQARGCVATLQATSYSLGAANTIADNCLASGSTTGFSVGAFAACGVIFCRASACTTDMTVNSAATLFDDRGSAFTGTVTNSSTSPAFLPLRTFFSSSTTSSTSPTFTPDISGGKNVNFLQCSAGSLVTCTLAAHATATLALGDFFIWVVQSTSSQINIVWNAQYKNVDASAMGSGGTKTINANNLRAFVFQWNGTSFIRVFTTPTESA